MAIAAEKIRRFNQPATITLSGNRTLTEADLLADVITFEGSPGANCTVTAPKIEGGVWLIRNDLTGAYTITMGAVVVPNGQSAFVACVDGAFELAGKDSPQQAIVVVNASSYAITSTAEFLLLTFDGDGDSWTVNLPQVASVPLGRKITLYSASVSNSFDNLTVLPHADDTLNGSVNGEILVQSLNPGVDYNRALYAVFVRVDSGWQSETVRATDVTGAFSVVTLSL